MHHAASYKISDVATVLRPSRAKVPQGSSRWTQRNFVQHHHHISNYMKEFYYILSLEINVWHASFPMYFFVFLCRRIKFWNVCNNNVIIDLNFPGQEMSNLEMPRDLLGSTALQWHHNGCDNVSNHRCLDYLLNRLFRRRSKKTSKLRVTGLCEGNSPMTSDRLIPLTKGQ